MTSAKPLPACRTFRPNQVCLPCPPCSLSTTEVSVQLHDLADGIVQRRIRAGRRDARRSRSRQPGWCIRGDRARLNPHSPIDGGSTLVLRGLIRSAFNLLESR